MATTFSHQKRRSLILLMEDEKDESAKGFNIEMFKNKTNALEYQCMICKKICRNPVELSCVDDYSDDDMDHEHDDDMEPGDDKSLKYNHDVLYCEACLTFNLSSNNNQCPINPKHLKTHYNIARNIRKQINNLCVYCENRNKKVIVNNIEGNDNNGCGYACPWQGKLCTLYTHLKSCTYNKKIHCNICNQTCVENNIIEHNTYNIVKHITLLYEQQCISTENNKNEKNDKLSQNEAFTDKVEQHINDFTTHNNQLQKQIQTLKTEYNEWKIAYSLESSKKELKLKKQVKKQNDTIELLQKQHKQLQLRTESQNVSIESLNSKHQKLQNELDKLRKTGKSRALVSKSSDRKPVHVKSKKKYVKSKKPVRSVKHVKSIKSVKSVKKKSNVKNKKNKKDKKKVNKKDTARDSESESENENTNAINSVPTFGYSSSAKSVPVPKLNLGKIPILKRASSMKYFHPKGTEKYHPKGLKYEIYHPQKSEEVWVSKTIGSMSKLHRFPCCGSAKEGSIYLMLADSNKEWDEELYLPINNDKLPANWNDNMYLGCKKNKEKNENNMSYYECCDKSILSVGCKKRYKCCKKDYDENINQKSEGCKVGWGC